MNNKVRELYKNPVKRKTIGESHYEYWEIKIKRNNDRQKMLRKLKRENRWKHLEE